ncbi:hypothetical protein FB451DRAFT_1184787 [Mycena latifolia]|nr:hypothetical protein FB451DRAFT_1184787 [Mycena latifolia]
MHRGLRLTMQPSVHQNPLSACGPSELIKEQVARHLEPTLFEFPINHPTNIPSIAISSMCTWIINNGAGTPATPATPVKHDCFNATCASSVRRADQQEAQEEDDVVVYVIGTRSIGAALGGNSLSFEMEAETSVPSSCRCAPDHDTIDSELTWPPGWRQFSLGACCFAHRNVHEKVYGTTQFKPPRRVRTSNSERIVDRVHFKPVNCTAPDEIYDKE